MNDVATKIAEDTNLISECANFDTIYKEEMIEKLFDLPPIKGLASAFIQKNQGTIPVYGGKKYEEPVGYIQDNLKNVKYFENCLAWNREGSIGYVFYRGHKFTTNDHHRPIIIKAEYRNTIDI